MGGRGASAGTGTGNNTYNVGADLKKTFFMRDGDYFIRTEVVSAGSAAEERYEESLWREELADAIKANAQFNRVSRELDKALADIDTDKTGANYRSLPVTFQRSINDNLKPTSVFNEYALNGNETIQDEWRVGLSGMTKRYQKVLTDIKDGKIQYTVKEGNKILLKTGDKNRVANKIAEFYNEELKKWRKSTQNR